MAKSRSISIVWESKVSSRGSEKRSKRRKKAEEVRIALHLHSQLIVREDSR
jgi:hypothetical protein